MAISEALTERTLERLRERYRARFPDERLILFLDQRAESGTGDNRTSVIAIDRRSAWYELLPPEQIVEIFDRERSA